MLFSSSVPWWTSSRLGLAILGFFGFINVYALRVNMSVAIVCMVNHTATSIDDAADNTTTPPTVSQCGLIPTGNTNLTLEKSQEVKRIRILKTL